MMRALPFVATVLAISLQAPALAQDEILVFEGRVVWISGQRMILALDSAPTVSVDLTRISQADLRRFGQNDYVVVTGVVERPGRTILAFSVRWISRWYPQPP
jgi:hypothetical protein